MEDEIIFQMIEYKQQLLCPTVHKMNLDRATWVSEGGSKYLEEDTLRQKGMKKNNLITSCNLPQF